jgi:hypothetical protein
MPDDGPAPNALDRRDAEALIGLLAVVEGHLINGDLDPHVVDRLGERLVGPGAGAAELRVALGNLTQRLHYVLGDHEEPPIPDPGLVDLYVGFASEADAQAFTEAAPSAGAPVVVDGTSYDDETVRWQVAVRSTTLPLSAEFDVERGRLLALGRGPRRPGRRLGWPAARAQALIRPSTAANAMSVRQCASASRTAATRS